MTYMILCDDVACEVIEQKKLIETSKRPDDGPTKRAERFAEGFLRGRNSVFRTNIISGCSCIFDNQDNIIQVCGAHQNLIEAALQKDDNPEPITEEWFRKLLSSGVSCNSMREAINAHFLGEKTK